MTTEREVLEVDVLFVGAGPACLAGALHLRQLLAAHDATASSDSQIGDVEIAVIEKGREIGMHSLSGAVLDPRALRELLPDFLEQGVPLENPVDDESIYFLSRKGKMRLPITPPPLNNHGNYIVSLHKLTRWLGEKVEAAGVHVFAGFSGAELLYEGDRVVGVRTGDRGIDRHGERKSNFEPGIDIRAKVTVLGEGARGHLTKQLLARLGLDKESLPQLYSTGVKELWKLPPGTLRGGRVIHTLGFPAPRELWGGGFVYNMADDVLSLGYVVGLDYTHPDTDPHMMLQQFKSHPFIASLLAGGEMIAYGAKTISEGGYYTIPRPYADGVLLLGESAAMLNAQRLKGIHLAMKSGMLAAETIVEALARRDTSAATLAGYAKRFEGSWARDELYRVRNFRQGFAGGLFHGLLHTGLQMLSRGRGVFDRRRIAPVHSHMRKLDQLGGATAPGLVPDGKLTFTKLTDVYHSSTTHEEDQPCHLRIADFDICNKRCTVEYGNPCQHFCPAQVYEMVEASGGGRELFVNFTNCVHCKTCDIADPYQIIQWVTPEGGGGPSYINM